MTWSGISASSAGATVACPARLALPQIRTTGKAAERGTYLHNFARSCTVKPENREKALLEVPEEYRHTAEGMNLALALEGLTVVGCERAYALDVEKRTCRYIGENIDRNYQANQPLSKYEIPFSVDVEASYQGVPVELDYKSGKHIGDPSSHWQRRVCAMGLMFYHDSPSAISRVAYIYDDGSIHPDGCEFGILDAEDFCDTLVKTIDAVEEARKLFSSGVMPTLHPSDDACSYCPAMMSCPSYTNFAKAMLGKLEAIEKGPELSTLSPSELGEVWEMAKKAEKILDPLFKSLKKIASEQPLPIGEEYEIRPMAKSKNYFNDSAARGLLITVLGKLGHDDEAIQRQMQNLYYRSEYSEFRKLKRA